MAVRTLLARVTHEYTATSAIAFLAFFTLSTELRSAAKIPEAREDGSSGSTKYAFSSDRISVKEGSREATTGIPDAMWAKSFKGEVNEREIFSSAELGITRTSAAC